MRLNVLKFLIRLQLSFLKSENWPQSVHLIKRYISRREIMHKQFQYLHSEKRAPVVSGFLAYLKNLAVATFSDHFAQLEILRPDPSAVAVDIVLAYRHRLHRVRATVRAKKAKKNKKNSSAHLRVRAQRRPRAKHARRSTHFTISFTSNTASHSSYERKQMQR